MPNTSRRRLRPSAVLVAVALLLAAGPADAATQKPPLHARKWLAITGKPLAATAGARIFEHGGNAVDAACAMLAASATMWDTLGWGGETQALVWNPIEKRVIGVNALGVAPAAATAALYQRQGLRYPPEYGPLAAVTPGTPGGLMVMLAQWGRLSLSEVLAPAIEMADGYPIEAQLANTIHRQTVRLGGWPFSKDLFLVHPDRPRQAPDAGELFRQPDLARTLRRLVAAEQQALVAGKSRSDAILAASELFYRGDLARELVAAAREVGAPWQPADLADWQVKLEEPLHATYHGVDVYKLDVWTQGPALLQTLELLNAREAGRDGRPARPLADLGFNSPMYIHTLAQAMHLAFADRDFYYGDPAFPPAEPVSGLLSPAYAAARWQLFDPAHNRTDVGPGDPYPFQTAPGAASSNPFSELLRAWNAPSSATDTRPGFQVSSQGLSGPPTVSPATDSFDETFRAGTTSVLAADAEGWVVSMTPSGGWLPAVVAGHTGIGLSQRMQSFVLTAADGPYNVIAAGKRPRVTLTPTLALKDGKPYLAAAVQGGDTQDQNLLQFLLDVVDFGMTPQQATEAANFTTYQMRSSFGDHASEPGRLTLRDDTADAVRGELRGLGYRLDFDARTSGPINAILIDQLHGTLWGGSSNHGEDYGIGW
jgi:gamma-glutamyltranspeptidase/glutathione hydrolase